MHKYFTSEMVGRGHPDKMCDSIADAVLDTVLKQDKNGRVAIEVTGGKGILFITGELTFFGSMNLTDVARQSLKANGYPHWDTIKVIENIGSQSLDIDRAVSLKNDIGAGDQGMMFGYATDETDNYLPLEYYWARKLAKSIDKNIVGDVYGSDFKTQITTKNSEIETVIVSIQHSEAKNVFDVRKELVKHIRTIIPGDYDILVNSAGPFNTGWFEGDAGTTGRKIVVDSYGSKARVGGGAFSGKDFTKVDRSAAYYARYVAKNMVAHGYAKKMEIQVAYGIGMPRPLSIEVETFGTETIEIEEILRIIDENFDFSVKNIIDELGLRTVEYSKFNQYGHFGNPDAPWEKIKDVLNS